MMMPGNVVKFYKKEVLENLEDCESAKHVAIWYQRGQNTFCHNIYIWEKELGRMKKELTTYDRGKCRKLFFL